MDVQVVNEGRQQGGRAPYGHTMVDGGPHPNPRKAAEGYRLRVLAIDETSADVVRRIFADYLDGKGDRAIADALGDDGTTCPSARRPDQNRHRLADGWRRLQAAVEAGADPAKLVEGINEAQAERAAARAALQNASASDVLADAEIYAMIDSLGDVGAALADAKPASLGRLYQQLRVRLRYEPDDQAVLVTAEPRVDSARVRGGT